MKQKKRRDPRYQALLNSKRWKNLRRWYLQQHPLCERCVEEGQAAGIEEGFIRSAVDVHHIRPVEEAKTEEEMKRLTFDIHNLRALCIPCHVKTHQELGKNTKQQLVKRQDLAFNRWKDKLERGVGATDSDS